MMSQAAQDLNNGETRHESRVNHAHDHEDVPEREVVQWTKQTLSRTNVRTSVDRESPRELNKHTSRAEEVCKPGACSTDVHTQVHHYDTRRLDHALANNHTKGWRSASDAVLPGHRRAHWWVPAKTLTVHQCPHSGEAVGGPNAPQEDHNKRSSVKHGSGAS